MPWNGVAPNQSFGRTDGTRTGDTTWNQANAAGVKIVTSGHDTHDTDIKDGVNACLKKDGGNTATGNIAMGGYTITGIANATARTHPTSFAQAQDNVPHYVGTVGGTADAITLTPTIAIAAYAAGQRFQFLASGTNTGAVTVNVSGVGVKDIKNRDAAFTALSAGVIVTGTMQDIEYDGTRFQYSGAVPLADGDKGDITVSAGGNTWTIDNDVVTPAKMSNASTTARALVRKTAGAGDWEEGTLSELLDFIGSATRGDILYRGAASWARLPASTAGYLLQTNGAASDPTYVAPPANKYVNRAYVEYLSNAAITTTIPDDDTIPQNTEGVEILNVSITPSSATNRIRATFRGQIGGTASGTQTAAAALFRDSTANALAATSVTSNVFDGTPAVVAWRSDITLTFEHSPGTTSAVTYKIRVGPSDGGAIRLNGTNTARKFGGVSAATLVLEEITP